jgi:hypothetical protein
MHAGLAQVDRILKAKGNMTIDSRRRYPRRQRAVAGTDLKLALQLHVAPEPR